MIEPIKILNLQYFLPPLWCRRYVEDSEQKKEMLFLYFLSRIVIKIVMHTFYYETLDEISTQNGPPKMN